MSTALQLRNLDDLVGAHEWLFNQQRENKIDAKTADALNTTLKGQTYILGKLRLDYAKLFVQSQIKKINIPKGILPPIGGVAG
jgi:hypothetical protein